MSEWKENTIGGCVQITKGVTYASSDYASDHDGHVFLTIKCFSKGGGFNPEGVKYYRGPHSPSQIIQMGDLLIAKTDLTRDGDIIGSPMTPPDFGVGRIVLPSMDLSVLRPFGDGIDMRFLFYRLMLGDARRFMWAHSAGSTVLHLESKALPKFRFKSPQQPEQCRIAVILSTVDEAMEQTEALMAKLQQLKAGLMHDLFTRGVTPDGHLRPTRTEAPHLYHQTPLGWIPKEWSFDSIGNIADSVVDGPFGSNLKTEHYVVEPGVRVVRLQNVDEGHYNDDERAFVSERHANFLMRNQVLPGDVLIAGLGEDNNVVGRACCYPEDLPPAINKADCFRLRCLPTQALNAFVMFFLNTAAARRQIRRFEQGVTRRRINTGNMKKVIVSLPQISEQKLIVQRLLEAGNQIEISTTHLAKLRHQKQGLMQDLLTGRVPVSGTFKN